MRYDDANRLIYKGDNAATGLGFAYTLDSNGNRVTITENDGSAVNNTFDAKNSLTLEVRTGTSAYSNGYSYDLNNNLISARGNSYPVDVMGKITNAGFVYDTNGRVTARPGTDGTTYLSYDYAGRVTSLTLGSGLTTSYALDGDGRMLGEQRAGKNVYYLLDGKNVLKEWGTQVVTVTSTSGTPAVPVALRPRDLPRPATATGGGVIVSISQEIIDYTHGLGLLSQRTTLSRFYRWDGIGTLRNLEDSSRNIVASSVFDAYGLQHNAVTLASAYGFIGEEGVRGEKGQAAGTIVPYHMRARMYDPLTGRFTSRDPIWNQNLYEYGNDNPWGYFDADGEAPRRHHHRNVNSTEYHEVARNRAGMVLHARDYHLEDLDGMTSDVTDNDWEYSALYGRAVEMVRNGQETEVAVYLRTRRDLQIAHRDARRIAFAHHPAPVPVAAPEQDPWWARAGRFLLGLEPHVNMIVKSKGALDAAPAFGYSYADHIKAYYRLDDDPSRQNEPDEAALEALDSRTSHRLASGIAGAALASVSMKATPRGAGEIVGRPSAVGGPGDGNWFTQLFSQKNTPPLYFHGRNATIDAIKDTLKTKPAPGMPEWGPGSGRGIFPDIKGLHELNPHTGKWWATTKPVVGDWSFGIGGSHHWRDWQRGFVLLRPEARYDLNPAEAAYFSRAIGPRSSLNVGMWYKGFGGQFYAQAQPPQLKQQLFDLSLTFAPATSGLYVAPSLYHAWANSRAADQKAREMKSRKPRTRHPR